MIVRHPRAASKAVVFVNKQIRTKSGVDETKFGTGFIYLDRRQQHWLISNWHVFTGRRPDDPGVLLGNTAQSPFSVKIGLAVKDQNLFKVQEFALYADGIPLWRQHPQGTIFDIAALPIQVGPEFEVTSIQDASIPQTGAIEPGFDLIVIGFPFEAGQDVPYPLWKRAMLSSEPSVQFFGSPQVLLDMSGTPGMSGSPVFVSHDGFLNTRDAVDAQARVDAGKSRLWDEPELFDFSREKKTVELEWIGVYAGSTGIKSLDQLQLGRMYAASAVDDVVNNGLPGVNPFVPIDM